MIRARDRVIKNLWIFLVKTEVEKQHYLKRLLIMMLLGGAAI